MNTTEKNADFEAVRRAFNDYQFQESAERGYDAEAANKANNLFVSRAAAFHARYNQPWTAYQQDMILDKLPGARANITVATVGHNMPPETMETELRANMQDMHAALIKTAEHLAKGNPKACTDEAYAERLTGYIGNLTKAVKALDKARVDEEKPIKQQLKVVTDFFGGMKAKLEERKTAAKASLDAYMRAKLAAEQAARAAAAAKLREEAEAQRKAEQALYEAGRPMESGEAARSAQKIDKHAEHMDFTATLKTAQVAQVKSGTSSASYRKILVCEVTDRALLDLETLRPYFGADDLQRAVKAYHAATKSMELKGARIAEESTLNVRA